MTSDLVARVAAHKKHLVKGFTEAYGVTLLVYYEAAETRQAALICEKQLKEWKRQWKIELIEKNNPEWRDLFTTLTT